MSRIGEVGRAKASRTRLTEPTSWRSPFTTSTESMLSALGPNRRSWSNALAGLVLSSTTGKSGVISPPAVSSR